MSVSQECILTTYANLKTFDEVAKDWKDLEKEKSKIQVYYNVIGSRHLIQVVGRSEETFKRLMNAEIGISENVLSPTALCSQWSKYALYFANAAEKKEFVDAVEDAKRKIIAEIGEEKTEESEEEGIEEETEVKADSSLIPDKEKKLKFDDFEAKDEFKPQLDGKPFNHLFIEKNTNIFWIESGKLPFATIEELNKLISTLCSDLDMRVDVAIQAIIHMATKLRNVRVPGGNAEDMERLLRDAAEYGHEMTTSSVDAPKSRRVFIEDKVVGLLEDLQEVAVDYQQRNWALYDDEEETGQLLDRVLELLSDEAECEEVAAAILDPENDGLMTFVKLFNDEHRTGLRIKECKILGLLCVMGEDVASTLVGTDLPIFLAKCITNEDQNVDDESEERFELLKLSIALCTLLFSSGGDVPISTIERYDINLISFLLDLMESDDEELIESSREMVLSYNLVFNDNSGDNVVCNTIAARLDHVQSFGEGIAQLLAKGEDTVGQNSTIRLIRYLFTRRDTANLFYTTDMRVICEIIFRELCDLDEGDHLKIEYIQVYNGILSYTEGYDGHMSEKIFEILQLWSEGEADGADEDIQNVCKNLLAQHRDFTPS